MMQDLDSEEQYEQEPVESEENESRSDEPVLSEPETVHKVTLASQDNLESIPEGPAWYVIHCYSGMENKVRHNLEQRIETMGMKDKVFDVVVPTQEEIEVRDGKRRTVERHIYPGYVLVNMLLDE
jgi:transcriptional antiterminator NusG